MLFEVGQIIGGKTTGRARVVSHFELAKWKNNQLPRIYLPGE
jgi:hypothetical protein